jgi:hypothetical protein
LQRPNDRSRHGGRRWTWTAPWFTESFTCYQTLLLFNSDGDCVAARLRPGNVHSADGWEQLLLPEIERRQKLGKEVWLRADAAFAKPDIYEALEGVEQSTRSGFRPTTVSCGILPSC